MKKLLAITLMLCLLVTCGLSETVVRQDVTIVFPDVEREGKYTGEVNESGNPHGFGVFEAVNTVGARYIIVGEWVNGSQTGESWRALENGLQYIGMFEDGDLIKGKYVTDVKMAEYDRKLDPGYGYTPDSILDMDLNKLDDASVIRLITNIFGCEPLQQNTTTGYVWVVKGFTFCDMPIVAVWAMVNEKNAITAVSYMMVNSKYSQNNRVDEVTADLLTADKLITRLNARIGKTGVMMLDNAQQAGGNLSASIIGQIIVNIITNGNAVFSYSWDYNKGVIYNATRNEGSVLFTIQKGQ